MDLIGAETPLALPTLEATHHRRALLAEAMRHAAALPNSPGKHIAPPAPGEDTRFDQRLADESHDTLLLYLTMAGIHASVHGAPAALSLGTLDLAGKMAVIETGRMKKFAAARGFTDHGELLTHRAACVTLRNGVAPETLPDLADQEMAALHMSAPFSPRRVAQHLCDLLPITVGRVEPVRPDLIGESFLLPLVLGGRREAALSAAEEAVRLYRALASSRPDAFTPDLAGSLNNLANVLSDLGGSLFAWLQAKLPTGARAALQELRAAPADEDNQTLLRIHLKKALEHDPALGAELAALLPSEATGGTTQTATAGTGARVAQVHGSGNTVNLGNWGIAPVDPWPRAAGRY